jgi:hypothetical protein
MGSSGMRRKHRSRPPKVAGQGAEWGTVPLGQDPPWGPWGPMGEIEAYGQMARAWNFGTPRQRRAAAIFLVILAVPWIATLVGALAAVLRFD